MPTQIPLTAVLKRPGDTFCTVSGQATPSYKGKTDPNRVREAENLGRKKESGFHPGIYPRACKIVIFVSTDNSEENI